MVMVSYKRLRSTEAHIASLCHHSQRCYQNLPSSHMMPLYDISVVNVLRVITMRANIMKLKMGAIVLKQFGLRS